MTIIPLLQTGQATGQTRLRYLAGLVLTLLGTLLLALPVVLGLQALMRQRGHVAFLDSYLLLGVNALVIPVLWLVMARLHRRPFMDLIAPGRRFDTGMLARSALVFAVPLLAQVGWGLLAGDLRPADTPAALFLTLLPLTLLLFLAQASAEELLFRGYLAQGMQVAFRHALPGALIGAVLFTAAHEGSGSQAVWTQRATIMVMALFLSWTTVRFGRLEAAMGIHIVNNVLFSVFIGGSSLPFPGVTTLTDPDPPDFQDMAAVLEFAAVQAAAIGFYWLAGVRTGFIARGLPPRQA